MSIFKTSYVNGMSNYNKLILRNNYNPTKLEKYFKAHNPWESPDNMAFSWVISSLALIITNIVKLAMNFDYGNLFMALVLNMFAVAYIGLYIYYRSGKVMEKRVEDDSLYIFNAIKDDDDSDSSIFKYVERYYEAVRKLQELALSMPESTYLTAAASRAEDEFKEMMRYSQRILDVFNKTNKTDFRDPKIKSDIVRTCETRIRIINDIISAEAKRQVSILAKPKPESTLEEMLRTINDSTKGIIALGEGTVTSGEDSSEVSRLNKQIDVSYQTKPIGPVKPTPRLQPIPPLENKKAWM